MKTNFVFVCVFSSYERVFVLEDLIRLLECCECMYRERHHPLERLSGVVVCAVDLRSSPVTEVLFIQYIYIYILG